jgi:hypothetical protein
MSRATVAGLLASSKPPIGDRSSKLECVVNGLPGRSYLRLMLSKYARWREAYLSGKLPQMFGVGQSTISHILAGKTWASIALYGAEHRRQHNLANELAPETDSRSRLCEPKRT